MKRVLFLSVFLAGVAHADTYTAAPLSKKSVCYSLDYIVLDSEVKKWLGAGVESEIRELIKNKLIAYRVFKACPTQAGSTTLNVSVGSTEALSENNPSRGYIIRIYVGELSTTYKGFIIIWQYIGYGVSGGSTGWVNNLKTNISQYIDAYVADYVIANP